MSIIDSQLVNIEITTVGNGNKSVLRLNYQAQKYDLIRVIDRAKINLPDDATEQIEQRLQQLLIPEFTEAIGNSPASGYLLVREPNFYSAWQLERATATAEVLERAARKRERDMEFQLASIWLFQELWLQLEDLLGAMQLQLLSENLMLVTPQFKSWADLDLLLSLDPLAAGRLKTWSRSESIAFAQQIYHLAQRKLGAEFGTELTAQIVRSMPNPLRSALESVLDL